METFKKPSKTAPELNMCSVWCPKKKLSCAQPLEWPFELGFTKQIHKILEDNSEHWLSGFLRNTFRKGTSQRKPRNIFQSEKFQDYFWETSTSLFLGGSAFRHGKTYILDANPNLSFSLLSSRGTLQYARKGLRTGYVRFSRWRFKIRKSKDTTRLFHFQEMVVSEFISSNSKLHPDRRFPCPLVYSYNIHSGIVQLVYNWTKDSPTTCDSSLSALSSIYRHSPLPLMRFVLELIYLLK